MSQIVKEEKLVYTAQEVAKILHASPNYVYELIRKGKLKAFKLKSIRILKSALEDFIKQNEGNDLSDIDNHYYFVLLHISPLCHNFHHL